MINWQDPTLDEKLSLLPGKTSPDGMWLPVWRHMLDCGLVMQRLFRQWIPESVRCMLQDGLTEEEMEQFAVLAALLHDIGKLTPVFSSKLLPLIPELQERLSACGLSIQPYESMIDPGNSPHALAGAAWLRMVTRGCPYSLASVIAAHHGKPATANQAVLLDGDDYPYANHLYGKQGAKSAQGIVWDEMRRSWLDYALSCCSYKSLENVPEISRRAQMVLTGLLIVADWIASNTAYFPLLPEDETPGLAVEEARADLAMKALALPFPLECDIPPLNANDFAERFGFAPRPLQQVVLDIAHQCVEPGLMIIEAQMGVGKTEAALTAAEHFAQKCGAGGIFFALPTQATANGIFPRLMSWAEPLSDEYQQAVKLAHGTANMNQLYMELPRCASLDADGLVVHPWMEGRKKSLLANVVIGTVDQLLIRHTRREPSKSGVIGLLACALGIRRDAALAELSKLSFGVRVDQEGQQLMDYQTVKSYKSKEDYLDEADPVAAYQTYRYYLADAVFLAAVSSDDDVLMEKLEAALHRPAFPLFLGRRSCPPTLPLSLGLRELPLEDALRNEPWKVSAEYQERWQRKHPGQTLHLRMLLDANTEAASIAQVRDVPLSYDPAWRRYSFRNVKEDRASLRFSDTTHDAMAEVEACT